MPFESRMLAVLLTALTLAACSATVADQPTPPMPNAVPTTAPTTAAASPLPSATPLPPATAAPTVPASPTAATMQPALAVNPASGAPGTRVTLSGIGYLPGAQIAIRMGLPNPLGEVLASVNADRSGSWTTELVIPTRLPSGELIVTNELQLVALDAANRELARTGFAFAGITPEQAGMPGPGWQLALTSDVNRDGIPDMVYYHPSDAVADVGYSDPRLAAVAVVADALEIVQFTAGERQVLLSADRETVRADVTLLAFATTGPRNPAAYLLALDPAQGPLVNLLPYGAGGVAFDGPFSFDWNSADGAFRLIRS